MYKRQVPFSPLSAVSNHIVCANDVPYTKSIKSAPKRILKFLFIENMFLNKYNCLKDTITEINAEMIFWLMQSTFIIFQNLKI